jgi:predicted negative regulator of RcsB-dependent stress response
MAKKTKVESKKPDAFVTAYQNCVAWIKSNTRTSIIIGVVIVCLGLAVWGLSAYQANKNQEAQYALSQGIKNFDEYTVTGKGDGLSKAEEDFKGLTKKGPARIRDVAELYLARIAIMKGKPDEARALYAEVLKHPSNDVVKKLSENGLGDLQKKP